MDFSLFDEAARDYDAEAAERRTAMVRSAVTQEIFPFLAVAGSAGEYAHRKALAAERLSSIATRCEASYDETEAVADRMFARLLESRQRAAQGSLGAEAKSRSCANCTHASPGHSEGGNCPSCGCTSFRAESKTAGKEARLVTAEGQGEGPFS